MTSALSIQRHSRIVGGRRPLITWSSRTSSSAMCMWAAWPEGGITSQRASCIRSLINALPVFLMTMESRRTLWTLYAINFLNAVGMWFFLPLLPIFLGRKGGSAALVGVVFAAGLLANGGIRYPAGWGAHRFGTRAVLVAPLLVTAVLFFAHPLPLPLGAFLF